MVNAENSLSRQLQKTVLSINYYKIGQETTITYVLSAPLNILHFLEKKIKMFNSMRTIFVFLLFSQSMITVLAVLLNILLVVVISFTPAKIGAYKHLMKAFAVFEAIYAIVVFVGMPVGFKSIHDKVKIGDKENTD